MKGKSNAKKWISKEVYFVGNVQQISFRELMLEPIRMQALSGYIGNNQYNRNVVYGLLGGKEEKFDAFLKIAKSLLKDSGVEIKVMDAVVSREALPFSALKLSNSMEDVHDRFDLALRQLTLMNEKLDRILAVLENMLANQNRMLANQEKMLANQEKHTKLLDMLIEKDEKSLVIQDRLVRSVEGSFDSQRKHTELLDKLVEKVCAW
jgi:acylphosphatase